jgi:hypothetical protein
MKNVTENNQLCPEMISPPPIPCGKFRGQDRRRPAPNGCTCLIEVAAAVRPVAASAGCAGMRFWGCFEWAVCRVCVGGPRGARGDSTRLIGEVQVPLNTAPAPRSGISGRIAAVVGFGGGSSGASSSRSGSGAKFLAFADLESRRPGKPVKPCVGQVLAPTHRKRRGKQLSSCGHLRYVEPHRQFLAIPHSLCRTRAQTAVLNFPCAQAPHGSKGPTEIDKSR